jgi:hypothetical protein
MAPALIPYVTGKRKKVVTGTGMTIRDLVRLKKLRREATDMEQANSEFGKPSFWQLVFLQSKVNGARYSGEELPGRTWNWPKDTYLQRRLQKSRWYQQADSSKMN